MPGFDGTGPRGMGPMTGGGRGYCCLRGAGGGRAPGRGWGRGGRGYGYPGRWPASGFATHEQEIDYLSSEAEALKGMLAEVEARVRNLQEKQK